jgi:hypothetical protein
MIRRYRRLMLKITLVLFCLVVVLITVRGGQAQYVRPDGSSVASGPCTLCPNGPYIGGGRHVNSRPAVRSELAQTATPSGT